MQTSVNKPRGEGLAVRYHDGATPVRPGDRIQTKMLFFWTLVGDVLYVPGISEPRAEMTFDGITNVGVRGDDGDMYPFAVDPETATMKKSFRLLSRGPDPGPLGPEDQFFLNEQ